MECFKTGMTENVRKPGIALQIQFKINNGIHFTKKRIGISSTKSQTIKPRLTQLLLLFSWSDA